MKKKTNLVTLFLLLFAISFYLTAQTPESAIIVGRVNSDYTTIQAAINDPNVLSGSTIFLTDNIHTEQNILINKNITIIGKEIGSTIVQAAETSEAATGRVFEIEENILVTLKNITVRYGNVTQCPKTGGGIYSSGHLVLENCTVTENRSSSGGGITMKRGTIVIRECVISNNTAHGESEVDNMHGSGGGIKAGEGDIRIFNSVIKNNSSNKRGGGIKLGCLCTMELDSSLVHGNTAIGDGGGINIKGIATISNTTVTGNHAKTSGGIYNKGTLTISNSRINSNEVNLKYGCTGLLNATEGVVLSITDCEIDELRGVENL